MLLANELLKPISVSNIANDVVWLNHSNRFNETGLSASVNLKCLSRDLHCKKYLVKVTTAVSESIEQVGSVMKGIPNSIIIH